MPASTKHKRDPEQLEQYSPGESPQKFESENAITQQTESWTSLPAVAVRNIFMSLRIEDRFSMARVTTVVYTIYGQNKLFKWLFCILRLSSTQAIVFYTPLKWLTYIFHTSYFLVFSTLMYTLNLLRY